MNEVQRARLALWHAAESDAETRELLTENAALLAENATLRIRLARALEGERAATQANRRTSLLGAAVALWDTLRRK